MVLFLIVILHEDEGKTNYHNTKYFTIIDIENQYKILLVFY
jgi:hypothetical protein